MWTRFPRQFAFIALVIACLAGIANAQSGAGSITGLITDETGGALPGVTITATNQATSVDYAASSNQAGNYTIEGVPVGTYLVKAVISGFRTSTTPAFALEARQVARLDFKLSVGALQESVEVSGIAPILQTETPTVGEVISGNTAQSLPLNGRNIGQLALLLTGTTTYNPRGFTNIGSINMNRPFVNGNREQTNNFTVDGFDVNETIDNRVAFQPIPDAVAEISVETNNYPADVGNVGGAIVSSVIKSGSNAFHGNGFEFYRNSRFDANTWENNRSAAPKQERTQHIFGGTFGGPVSKGVSSSLATISIRARMRPASALCRSHRKRGAAAISRAWRRRSKIRSLNCPFQTIKSRSIASARLRDASWTM